MLQIDENQLQVYSCSFQLVLGSTLLPVKLKDTCYYIDWKVKHKTSQNRTQLQTVNEYGYLEFKTNLKLHTEILRNVNTGKFQKKYSQLTLFLISSKLPQRPKIVGSMLIGLHEVLNNGKYSQMNKNRLSLSPFDVEVEFKCRPIQCGVSSILEANLDSAMVVNDNFLTRSGSYPGMPFKEKDNNFLKKKITAQLMAEDDGLSRGECSYLEPDLQDPFGDESPIFQKSSILINSACLISQPYFQLITHVDQESETKIKTMQNQDLEAIVRENINLKRLLMISKNERKIEYQRYEEEIRQLARELSIKEAQVLKITETQKSGSMKVGELMDQAIGSNVRVIALLKETESYKQQLTISQQYAFQLQQNYKRLEVRLQIVKDWQQERRFLLQKIHSLQQDNQQLKLQYCDVLNKKSLFEEQHYTIIRETSAKLHELEAQLQRRDKIITLYEEKVSKFQEEISQMQEEEVVSRVSYSAVSEAKEVFQRYQITTEGTPRRKGKRAIEPIFIEEEGLNRIKEEELEESLQSGEKQIATTAELPETTHTNQSDFYRKMARNVQQQLDQLRFLYREKDLTTSKERTYSKSLKEELERLRFEFVYELSKVTALLNQKILQIRQLKEQNARLKQNSAVAYYSQIYNLQSEINVLQEQRLDYFDRCYRLEEENIALLNLTREKEDIYQSIIRGKDEVHQKRNDEEIIVTQFQKIMKVMTGNEQRYSNILKKHGFLPLFNENGQSPLVNISQIIKKQSMEYNLSESGSRTSSLPSQQDLLLESHGKNNVQHQEPSEVCLYLQKMAIQLSQLKTQRQKGFKYIKELSNRSSLPTFSKDIEKIGPLIQNLKKNVVSLKEVQVGPNMLKIIKNLEQLIGYH